MDFITKLYKHRAEVLSEQVSRLEAQLKYLSEDNPKYGRGTRSGVVGGSGTVQGSEEIDFTGGNVDPKTGAWSPSSGGPAIADSEAGDNEIKDRMRKIARGGGLFDKGVEQTEQTPAYKEMAAELERRKAARAGKASGGKSGAEGGAGVGTRNSDASSGTAGTGTRNSGARPGSAGTGTQNSGARPGGGGAGRVGGADTASRTYGNGNNGTMSATGSGDSDEDGGIDPKLVVLGVAGTGYGALKAKEYYDRQRKAAEEAKVKAKTDAEAKAKAKTDAEAKAKAEKAKVRGAETPTPPDLLARPQEPVSGGQGKGQPPDLLARPEEPVKISGDQGRVKAPESTIGGEPVQKGKPSVADRAAMGHDALRARAETLKAQEDAAKAQKAEPSKAGEAKAAEVKAPPEYPAGSYSTPDGKVVTPGEGGGAVSKGSQVNAKMKQFGLKNFGKGVARFALVDVPAMMVADEIAQQAATSLGAGKQDAEIAGTVASFAPMAMNPVVSVAAVPGYIGGRLIDKAAEETGYADYQRRAMMQAANAATAAQRKGYNSQDDVVWNPQTGRYMTLAQSAEATKERSKEERRSDVGKGFAGAKEAEEFAKQMQDPEFRKKHEREMEAARIKEMQRQQGGSALAARAMGAAPDWLGDTIDIGAKGVEAAGEGLSTALDTAIDYTPGGKYVAGKVGQFFNWLAK